MTHTSCKLYSLLDLSSDRNSQTILTVIKHTTLPDFGMRAIPLDCVTKKLWKRPQHLQSRKRSLGNSCTFPLIFFTSLETIETVVQFCQRIIFNSRMVEVKTEKPRRNAKGSKISARNERRSHYASLSHVFTISSTIYSENAVRGFGTSFK